jgi:hypothetical protein
MMVPFPGRGKLRSIAVPTHNSPLPNGFCSAISEVDRPFGSIAGRQRSRLGSVPEVVTFFDMRALARELSWSCYRKE